jgi:hypothetical protein
MPHRAMPCAATGRQDAPLVQPHDFAGKASATPPEQPQVYSIFAKCDVGSVFAAEWLGIGDPFALVGF